MSRKFKRWKRDFARVDEDAMWDFSMGRLDSDPTDTRGVSKLTATGCFNRHKTPRSEQELTKEENRVKNFEPRDSRLKLLDEKEMALFEQYTRGKT